MSRIELMLNEDEDIRLSPYLDCCGKFWRYCTCQTKGSLTIGVGRNLDRNGISKAEALGMRDNDIASARICAEVYPWFKGLCVARQDVILNMIFNMGMATFSEFSKMISAIERQDFKGAAREMMASKWSHEVGNRATRLAYTMAEGDYYPSPGKRPNREPEATDAPQGVTP